MIKISLLKDQIIIKGHANYAEYGNDIVCASVSSIAITTINAILRFDSNNISYIEKEGYLEINIINHTKEVDILLTNMIELFKELEKQYKNIKIN
ncbi:MAG: ribosomal-processing cysteine protease Prp [Bacilli bacterium]|nr:ribosomal-processing cysteine protease Prp [Bacilli bacterium]